MAAGHPIWVLGLGASASALTVAFSQIGQESDWRTANTDDLCNAIKAEGWNLVYDDAQQKQENQIKALRNFISQGVDYILFTGVVTTGWDEVLKEVNESGIPLILIDRMPDCAPNIEYAAAFGGDFTEEGRRMGFWAGNYLKSVGRDAEEINAVVLEGTTGATAPQNAAEQVAQHAATQHATQHATAGATQQHRRHYCYCCTHFSLLGSNGP